MAANYFETIFLTLILQYGTARVPFRGGTVVDELVSVGVCVLLPVLLGAGVRHSVKDKLSQRSGPCLGHGPISSWGERPETSERFLPY